MVATSQMEALGLGGMEISPILLKEGAGGLVIAALADRRLENNTIVHRILS